MKTALTRLYDRYTGFVLLLLVAAGLGLGGLAAYDPSRQPAEEQAGGATATPAGPAATQASISVSVPTASAPAETISEFGTLISPDSLRIFENPAGIASAPLADPDGGLFLTGVEGTLYSLEPTGAVHWSIDLPAAPVGDLALTATGKIVVADRSGRLAAYDRNSLLVWEFIPGETFTAVSGAALDAAGNLYYVLESGGAGFLQSISPGGTSRWRMPVETTSYRVTPWIHPTENLVFIKSAVYDRATGSPVQLEYPFTVDAWITSVDGHAFLQRGQTIAAWSLVDGVLTLPDEGPDFVIPDPGAIIRQASIDLNGISWIAYIGQTTDGIAWFNPDGSLLHQVVTGNVLLSIIAAEDEQGTLYACGPSPRDVSAEQLDQRSTYCLAFVIGEEKPRWQKPFAVSAQFFVGSFSLGNEVFIVTDKGDLVVLGRDQAVVQDESEPAGAAALPNGWLWKAPAALVNYPEPLSDGTLPLLLADGSVYFLAPDGSLSGSLELAEFLGPDQFFQLPVYFYDGQIVVSVLPDRVYAMQPGAGQLWEFPVQVFVPSPDSFETIGLHQYSSGDLQYLWDSSRTLYAYTPEGGLLWQYTLETGLRDDFAGPVVTDTGHLYLTDSEGTLYAFDETGPAWTFHPGGSLRGASDPRIGPDGNLYFVSTSGTSGFLEAVTPDGQRIWQVQLATFRFYNPPQFVSGGAYVRVSDDFVETTGGELLTLEFPFEVNTFIEGADGNNYLRTGNHIIQWQIGPEGYDEIRSIAVNMEGSNAFIQPDIRVYETGDIEIRIFDPNGSRFIWVDAETGAIQSAESPWTTIGFSTGEDGPEFVSCEQDLDAMLLSCARQIPGSEEPVWTIEIAGIDGAVAGFPPPILYNDGRLYVVAGGVNVYMFEVEIP